MSKATLALLPNGWTRYAADGWPGHVYLRLQPDDGGRWTVREMYLDLDGASLTPDALGQLNLTFLEAWANDESEHLARIYDQATAGDMSILASYIGETFAADEDAATNWVASAYFSSLDRTARDGRGLGNLKPPKRRKHAKGSVSIDTDYRLTAGPGSAGLTDEFLNQVRIAYYAALARGERPNKAMAEETGYSPRTTQGWVRAARLRGIMPKARKGAAG